ncbi:hypothetical protein KDA_68090 [Dictyobacter alpinus]|uniref:Photosynthesis system II assembly factor Ycf48/Hcf136-like domain-containing protein n=1 Tax=Dictyobacter alpinus TaxID=2014873 RepID=A0A402BIY5_9CHLR|nr:hypothetical protein [Dictyobacter alpinus]GCE31325.1 hypothetical protein KDA_68090 [Dictyobacter alpinus]
MSYSKINSFLITLLLALLLTSCGIGATTDTATSIPTSLSTATTIAGNVVRLQQIHMFNVSTGWSMTAGGPGNSSRRVLHTTKGVSHWQDVTPAIGNQYSFIGGSDFFDALTAWVVAGGAPGIPMVVYRTHDGGQSWQQSQLPDQGIGGDTFFFLNAQIGWLIHPKGAATGNVWVDILRTGDGGASWKIISSSSHTTTSPSALPLGGTKSISFVNEMTGWATSFTNRENFAWFYVTHDGGTTWEHQNIPLPAQASQITMLPPSFFSATDGLLPAIIPSRSDETMMIYVTHDGGESWQPTSPVHTGGGLIAIADAQHAWIINNSDDLKSNHYIHSTAYRTSDGGWHWTQYAVKFSANTTMINFASPTQGWAIDSELSLYQTADGGQTWMKVTPTIP